MEGLVDTNSGYAGKSVLVTGNTGFKGSWLSEWLMHLRADVHGYALTPPTNPSLFVSLRHGDRLVSHQFADIRNCDSVRDAVVQTQPDFIFHLAAQPIVRTGYLTPVETYATNVMGTIHVLEAARSLEKPCVVIVVTSDKCYENQHWRYPYKEVDRLGGRDPYSSSKAMSELAVSAYRSSFLHGNVRVASVRAGNVIGGGDWAKDRIVPDCVRALGEGKPIFVRNPEFTRPWQHVMDALSGYMILAMRIYQGSTDLADAFNFGPDDSNHTVRELVEEILKHWPGRWEHPAEVSTMHEAKLLKLSIDKACTMLGWCPVWRFADAVRNTAIWYREAIAAPDNIRSLTLRQIESYERSTVLS